MSKERKTESILRIRAKQHRGNKEDGNNEPSAYGTNNSEDILRKREQGPGCFYGDKVLYARDESV